MALAAIGEGEEEKDLHIEDDGDREDEIRLVEEDTIMEERDEEAELARGQFQLQCDRLIECIVIASRDVNEIIALYEEINNSILPISLKLTLGLLCSRLYRSMGDLDDTACELSRLIELYSAPWDGRAEALRRLHAQYRRNCRLLNAAIRKLHLATANSEQFRKVRVLNKWEQLFSVVMLAKGIGRRWKFKLPALRNAASRGPDAIEAYLADEFRQMVPNRSDEQGREGPTSEPDFELETSLVSGAKEPESSNAEDGKEEDDEEEEDDESDVSDIDEGFAKRFGKKMDSAKDKKSVRFRENDDTDDEILVARPQKAIVASESIGIWTHEPELERRLVIRLYRPSALRIATGNRDGRYLLRPLTGGQNIMEASPFFALNAMSLTGPNANIPIGDFVIDARTLLPEEAQLELVIGERPAAIGSINLRQLAMSDPAPITLPSADAAIPEDYPYAVRLTIPLYSTSLGSSVRVAVGSVPIAVFGIRFEVFKLIDAGIMTEQIEQIMSPAMLSNSPPPTNTSAEHAVVQATSAVLPTHHIEPSPRSTMPENTHVSTKAKARSVAQRSTAIAPSRSDTSTHKRPSSARSVALSPIHWETSASPERELTELNSGESETITELRRKMHEQQKTMSFALRSMEAELSEIKQRQAECDLCSGRSRMYGNVSSDPRLGRNSHYSQRAATRHTGPLVGTPIPPVRFAAPENLAREKTNDSIVTLPAIYMPSPLGHAYNAKAANYFHPIGHLGRRVTQPPSVFAMQVPDDGAPPIPSTVNLYALAVRQTESVTSDQRLKFASNQTVPKQQQQQI